MRFEFWGRKTETERKIETDRNEPAEDHPARARRELPEKVSHRADIG